MPAAATPAGRFRVSCDACLRHRPAAVRFQIGLLAVDFAAIAYFCATHLRPRRVWMRAVDLLLVVLLACEFLGRMLAHHHPMRYLENGAAVVDLAVIASLFASALGANLGFLRVLRTVGCCGPTTCSAASRSCPRRSPATRR
jgi:voltage-gated potassium channel